MRDSDAYASHLGIPGDACPECHAIGGHEMHCAFAPDDVLWCAACGKWGYHQSGSCPEIARLYRGLAVLTECVHCMDMVATRTGKQGVEDAVAQGWEIDGAGDLVCPRCARDRAEMIGDER